LRLRRLWYLVGAIVLVGVTGVVVGAGHGKPRVVADPRSVTLGRHTLPRKGPVKVRPRPHAASLPRPDVLGLPMAAEWEVVPVWTPQGSPSYLNANVTPVLVFPVSDPGIAKAVLDEAHHLNPKAKIAAVAAGFPSASLPEALSDTGRLAGLLGQPVDALQGSPSVYLHGDGVLGYLGHLRVTPTILPLKAGPDPLKPSALKQAFADTLDAFD